MTDEMVVRLMGVGLGLVALPVALLAVRMLIMLWRTR